MRGCGRCPNQGFNRCGRERLRLFFPLGRQRSAPVGTVVRAEDGTAAERGEGHCAPRGLASAPWFAGSRLEDVVRVLAGHGLQHMRAATPSLRLAGVFVNAREGGMAAERVEGHCAPRGLASAPRLDGSGLEDVVRVLAGHGLQHMRAATSSLRLAGVFVNAREGGMAAAPRRRPRDATEGWRQRPVWTVPALRTSFQSLPDTGRSRCMSGRLCSSLRAALSPALSAS